MSKSILVIDTPEGCESCLYCRGQYSYHCKLMQFLDKEGFGFCYVTHQVFRGGKPDWCPLRDLPEKEDCKNYLDDDAEAYCNGWNSCIDKILGD